MNVSVNIPVFNAARFVEQAIDSALAQPEAKEVILVDDGSSDDSWKICSDYAARDSRVRVFQHADGGNHGPATTRNLAIQHSTCPYVSFLDADDYFAPNRFRAAREVLTKNGEIDGVYDAVKNVFENEAARGQWLDEGNAEVITLTEMIPPERLFEALADREKGMPQVSGLTIRKRFLDRIGAFDLTIKRGEDYSWMLKASCVGKLAAGSIDDAMVMRRIHGGNVTIREQDTFPYHDHLMWKSIVHWANREGIHRDRKVLLLSQLVIQWCESIPKCNHWRGLHRTLRETIFLTALAVRHPLVILSLDYRRHFRRVLGLAALKSFLLKRIGRQTELADVSE